MDYLDPILIMEVIFLKILETWLSVVWNNGAFAKNVS